VSDERAARLHDEAVVVDAHSDVFCDVVRRRLQGETNVLRRLHVPAWRAGGVNVVVTTLYTEEEYKPDRALRRAVTTLGAALNDLDETYEVELCRTRADVDAAVTHGKLAFILAIEGGEPIQHDTESLRVFYQLGVRLLGLTWNQRNLLAEGVGEERAGGGLTELGREMVKEANRLGVLLDVSHLSVKSFWDLAEECEGPFVASHSNAKRLCGHRRNLDDEQLQAVAQAGGIIGINAVPDFLDDDRTKASVERAIDHVDAVAELVGAEHIALGPDFADYMRTPIGGMPAEFIENVTPATGWENVSAMGNVTAGLVRRGYDDATIRGILGGNFLRVFEQVAG